MKRQRGEATLGAAISLLVCVVILYLVSAESDSKRESEFISSCTARGGHIAKDGVEFLSAIPNGHQRRIKYLCIDSKGRIL